MSYHGIYESEGEYSCEDLDEEKLDASFRILYTKCEEACLTIDNQKKTIFVIQKEIKELASTITSVEKGFFTKLQTRKHDKV